jgi:phosphatidylglycerophosphatase C
VRLVVFDLDGTITRSDTLLPYVAGYLARTPWRLLRLLAVMPALLLHLLGRIDRGALKAALLRHTLGGETRAALDAWSTQFVARLLTTGVRREAMSAIDAHRRAGDRLVLMSASPDLYVPAIGRELGFSESVSTGVRWDGERLNGSLATPNRRGEEKSRCLEGLKREYPGLRTVAYGNSASDLPHLRLVDEPRLVNASPWAVRKAARAGITLYAHWH